MQLLIFRFSYQQIGFWAHFKPLFTPLGVWWAQMDFLAFGCFATKWPHHLRLFLAEFGGLKWTRTIDLTLIRRVL